MSTLKTKKKKWKGLIAYAREGSMKKPDDYATAGKILAVKNKMAQYSINMGSSIAIPTSQGFVWIDLTDKHCYTKLWKEDEGLAKEVMQYIDKLLKTFETKRKRVDHDSKRITQKVKTIPR